MRAVALMKWSVELPRQGRLLTFTSHPIPSHTSPDPPDTLPDSLLYLPRRPTLSKPSNTRACRLSTLVRNARWSYEAEGDEGNGDRGEQHVTCSQDRSRLRQLPHTRAGCALVPLEATEGGSHPENIRAGETCLGFASHSTIA